MPTSASASEIRAIYERIREELGESVTVVAATKYATLEDMELLADAEAADFVDDGEDLEFYEWAAGEVET